MKLYTLNFAITACDRLQIGQIVVAAGVFINGTHIEFSTVGINFQTASIRYNYKVYLARSK